MAKKKINVKIDESEQLFNEEVAEEELHSKIDVDDHIYVRNKVGIFGNPILAFLAAALVFSALFATFYGLLSLDSDLEKRDIGVIRNEYHLTVVHSDESYGGIIKNFKKYNSSSDAFSYNFSVANKNTVDLGYAVAVEKSSGSIDLKKVNYKLLRNGSTIKSGTLADKKSNKIYDTTAIGNTTDEYEIRLWVDNATDDESLTFKIKVLV